MPPSDFPTAQSRDDLPGPLQRYFAADYPVWALSRVVQHALSRLKSVLCSWFLHAPGIHLGPHSRIAGTRFIRFGRNFYAHGNLWLEALPFYKNQRFLPSLEIGDNVSFSERVHISCIHQIRIGNGVLIGSGAFIADHHHGIYTGQGQTPPEIPPADRLLGGGGPVTIEDYVWIGDNVVIVGPVTVGRGAIIGANSVVRRDIPVATMAAGVPARPIKHFDERSLGWERI